MSLKIRPHHFSCLTLFRGKGYNAEFIENVKRLIKEMTKPATIIEVVEGCDDVCSTCPHIVDNRCMKHENSEREVREIDSKWLKALELSYGTKLDVKMLQTLKEKLIIIKLQSICKNCEWLPTCLKSKNKIKV